MEVDLLCLVFSNAYGLRGSRGGHVFTPRCGCGSMTEAVRTAERAAEVLRGHHG